MSSLNSQMQRSPAVVCRRVDLCTGSNQGFCHASMSGLGSQMQRSLTIVRPKIDWDTHCKQNLDNPDLSFPRCRVQQGPAIDTGRKQDLDNPEVP